MKPCCPPGQGCNAPAGREEPCFLQRCRNRDSAEADRAVGLWESFPAAATASGSRRATTTWSPTTSSATRGGRVSGSESRIPSSAAPITSCAEILVKGSRDDGFLVNRKDNHSLLKGNTTRGAADDGF